MHHITKPNHTGIVSTIDQFANKISSRFMLILPVLRWTLPIEYEYLPAQPKGFRAQRSFRAYIGRPNQQQQKCAYLVVPVVFLLARVIPFFPLFILAIKSFLVLKAVGQGHRIPVCKDVFPFGFIKERSHDSSLTNRARIAGPNVVLRKVRKRFLFLLVVVCTLTASHLFVLTATPRFCGLFNLNETGYATRPQFQ